MALNSIEPLNSPNILSRSSVSMFTSISEPQSSITLIKKSKMLQKICEMHDEENIEDNLDGKLSNPTETGRLADLKLSKFYEKNKDLHLKKVKPSCKCKFSWFYVYTAFILAITIFVSVSPKAAAVAVKSILTFCKKVGKLPTPAPSIIFLIILYGHQFLGIPLQTASVMLITFSLHSFLHGFILAITANISSSLIMYILFQRCLRKRAEKNHKDNILVIVIKEESAKHPIRVSFIFRFMYIPALYKNVGLGLSPNIGMFWFLFPALFEAAISNAFICFLGSVMNHGLDVLNPASISKKSSHAKALFIISYALMGLQIICVVAGVCMMLSKLKKISEFKKKIAIEKWREGVKLKGYIHDLEENHNQTKRKEEDIEFYEVQESHTDEVTVYPLEEPNYIDAANLKELVIEEISPKSQGFEATTIPNTNQSLSESQQFILLSPAKDASVMTQLKVKLLPLKLLPLKSPFQ